MVGGSTSHTACMAGRADMMSYRMDGGKRATSVEGKTIRIAESSDMESWEAMRTRTFSQSVAYRVMARDLGSTLCDDSAASTG